MALRRGLRSGSESRTDLTPSPIMATAEVGIGITRELMNHEDADRHRSTPSSILARRRLSTLII